MLRYKVNIIAKLKEAGYSQAALLRNGVFGGQDLNKMRAGTVVGINGLNKLCSLLHCQPGRLIEWVPDEEETK